MRIESIGPATLINADCRDAMRAMDESSVDAVVTDPPYGIGFMGKSWDSTFISEATKKRTLAKAQPPNPDGSARKNPRNAPSENAGAYDFSVVGNTKFQIWTEEWAREALRVLKPGGLLIVFSGPRTFHRMVCGVEDAGFEIRDQIFWVFGSGMPKSKNLHGEWEGWGTALKPAHEPICVARKPLIGTVAANVLAHGTGAMNIDGCRIEGRERTEYGLATAQRSQGSTFGEPSPAADFDSSKGRWPANLIHDGSDEVLALFPDSNGSGGSLPNVKITGYGDGAVGTGKSEYFGGPRTKVDAGSGSAARFFYCAKTSKKDRNEGCDELPKGCDHPTVKPTDLMRYLCRLVTPPGGVVLDPFMGSGSTGKAALREGFGFIGIDSDEEHGYFDIACARVRAAV